MHFKMRSFLTPVFYFFFGVSLLCQSPPPDSTKKIFYSAVANLPTWRNYLYSIGVERYQRINRTFAFTSSFSFEICPFLPDFNSYNFSACLQPFHLIIGSGSSKLETGLSVSYFNYNFNNGSGVSGYIPYLSYYAYIGYRYHFRSKPIIFRIGYAPSYSSVYFSNGFSPIGFEIGLYFILRKGKNALLLQRIKKEYFKNQGEK